MFEVDWSQEAANQLATIWTAAEDRNGITAASYALDQALALDPLNQGESRVGNDRVLFAPPLAVRYTIDQVNRTVTVLACWRFRTRG